jgi:hypothetical protein
MGSGSRPLASRIFVWVVLAALPVFVSSCTTPPTPSARTPSPTLHTYRGTISYEARTPTPTGASRATVVRYARRVELLVRGPDNAIIDRASTDDVGRFSVEAPASGATLLVVSRIEALGLAVTADSVGLRAHAREVPLADPQMPVTIAVTDADEDGFAGALHILDAELEGALAVRRWIGEELPPLFTYWGRGQTTVWSFYHGERPADSGRYALELMGGDPGAQETSDTDEHDEAIVLHEMGHFVMDRLTSDSSTGGDHPTGHLYDPGLAWEEARASFFATAVLGAPLYWDTIGIEPHGSLRISHDLERGIPSPRGPGSEQGIAEILWDLADGAGGLPDVDHDGVALGPAGVIEAMVALADEPGSYASITSFLRHLVDHGHVTEEAMKELLSRGGHPESLLPERGSEPWPVRLPLPGRAAGKIDGLSDPAPSGGGARPSNGYDAVSVYRVHVERAGRLSVRLTIFGSGRGADHQDLDVEVRSIRAELLAASRAETPVETLNVAVEPGYYVIYVRDGGQGNRVGFELEVAVD